MRRQKILLGILAVGAFASVSAFVAPKTPLRRARFSLQRSDLGTPLVRGSSAEPELENTKPVEKSFDDLSNLFMGVYSSEARGLINLLFVASVFSFVGFQLMTVDASQWRGWTWTEVFLRLLPDNWAAYEMSVAETPLISKSLLNFVIYCLGDYIAQMGIQRAALVDAGEEAPKLDLLDFDAPRALRNGAIGFALGPICHYYYEMSDFFISPTPDWHKPIKIAIDQTFWASVWNGAYYFLLNISKGNSVETAWKDVRVKWWPMLKAGWRLWPFAHIITYGFVPGRHRLLFVDIVDLGWCSFLATAADNAELAHGAEEDAGADTDVEATAEPIVSECADPAMPAVVDTTDAVGQ